LLTAPKSNLWNQRRSDFATLVHDYDGMVKMEYHFMRHEDDASYYGHKASQ